ncbi:UNVERIFIED_ORG: hypothetical protein GGI63_005257 [Rhizobium esperanzae]
MDNTGKILGFLRSISPKTATNSQIVSRTGIRPHQQVFQITRRLCDGGQIRGRLFGKEWEFWTVDNICTETIQGENTAVSGTALAFERWVRGLLQERFGCPLPDGTHPDVHKRWDFISPDGSVIGDAKFYSLVNGERYPPAKMATISEHVWLLSQTDAKHRFIVFGNDVRVPEQWLSRYGRHLSDIRFYFADERAGITVLT